MGSNPIGHNVFSLDFQSHLLLTPNPKRCHGDMLTGLGKKYMKHFSFLIPTLFCISLLSGVAFYASDQACCNTFLSCVVLPCNNGCNGPLSGKTFFSIRPQDSNAVTRIIRIALEDYEQSWGFNVAGGVQRSFARGCNSLAQWFLPNGGQCVTVGMPDDEHCFAIDGGQFGLQTQDGLPGLMGALSLNPSIKNVIGTLNAWVNLDAITEGLFLRTYLTLVNAKTSLGMRTRTMNVAQSGVYPTSLYTVNCTDSPIAYHTLCQAFMGNVPFGDIPALSYAKFYGGSCSTTALASIRFDLGYDVVDAQDGFFNAGVCFLIPTGTRPTGRYLFEPVVGANRSWQVGVIFSGAYEGWQTTKNAISLYVDATITYLTKAEQTRVFGLKNNGRGSQYLLLKKIDTQLSIVSQGERVANIFAGKAAIGGNVMADAALMLELARNNGLFFDLGYNFWMRSAERIAQTVCMRNFTPDTYGLKGDLLLSEFDTSADLCIGDVATASQSTLCRASAADATTVTLNVCDIDPNVPLHPSAFSNKIFAALGYSADVHNKATTMNIFVQGEVEFGQARRALNQWAVSLNIGFSL
jgi:hypothetical protein